eukprot:SAG31_NODE_30926_length_374_cov_1.127273_1_plen_100_part_01
MVNANANCHSQWTLANEAAVLAVDTVGLVFEHCKFERLDGSAILLRGKHRDTQIRRVRLSSMRSEPRVIFLGIASQPCCCDELVVAFSERVCILGRKWRG